MSKKILAKLRCTQKQDSLKNKKILNNKQDVAYFFRFSHKDDIIKESVIKRLEELGLDIKTWSLE